MEVRKISNIRFYFQVVKSTANASADNEQILGEHFVVNKSPIEIRVPDEPFYPNDFYVFPKRVFGKQNRFCNSKWFKLYPPSTASQMELNRQCLVNIVETFLARKGLALCGDNSVDDSNFI